MPQKDQPRDDKARPDPALEALRSAFAQIAERLTPDVEPALIYPAAPLSRDPAAE
jgi:hypothetical protein